MRDGLILRGLGTVRDAARPPRPAPTREKPQKIFLDEWSTDPETDVAPGVTQGRNMRSRC